MRYYVVGLPVEDLQGTLGVYGTLFFGVRPRAIPLNELKASFYNQDQIKIFVSYDDAIAYANALRVIAYDFSAFPKNGWQTSKVRPVFTVDAIDKNSVGKIKTETLNYEDIDDRNNQNKKLNLEYYLLDTNLVNESQIVRVEFSDSPVKPIEFVHVKPGYTCNIV